MDFRHYTDDELTDAVSRIDLSERDPKRMEVQEALLLECARRMVTEALANAREADIPSFKFCLELDIGPLSKNVGTKGLGPPYRLLPVL